MVNPPVMFVQFLVAETDLGGPETVFGAKNKT